MGQDKGFQGFTVPNVIILQPTRKPPKGELDALQQSANRWIASFRIRVEHAVGSVKRYRMVRDEMRNHKAFFRDAVIAICCGLHNFRIRFRPFHYPPLQLHLAVGF